MEARRSPDKRVSSEGKWLSPSIEVGEGMSFNYANTRIRLFSDSWEELNHVEYIDEEGNLRGIRVTQELMDQMMEMEFPYSFDYFPDDATLRWHEGTQSYDLEGIDLNGLPPEFDDMM